LHLTKNPLEKADFFMMKRDMILKRVREGWQRLAHSRAAARTISVQPDPQGHAQMIND
jgi:hypothetical protein